MPLHLPLRPGVRAALVVLAAAASLATASPAAGQEDSRRPPPPVPPAGSCDLPVQRPILENGGMVLRQTAALFPADVRGRGIADGNALVRFRVLADSSVDPASISVESTSEAEFAEPARTVAAAMRFSPAQVGGRAVPAWLRYRLTFEDPQAFRSDESYDYVPLEREPVLQNGDEVAHESTAVAQRGTTGTVLVQFRVERDGSVHPGSAVAVEMATDPALEAPAMEIVRRMRFTPATVGRTSIPTPITMPIHFGCMRGE